jgi:hypothetical protein
MATIDPFDTLPLSHATTLSLSLCAGVVLCGSCRATMQGATRRGSGPGVGRSLRGVCFEDAELDFEIRRPSTSKASIYSDA